MKKLLLVLTLLFIPFHIFGAINATTVWEFRATNGSATNGGGYYNANPGTSVDYSNQNSSQLTINDGATSGIGVTTLTSAAAGFTGAMAGNVIYLQTGTNLTDGWYQITVVTNATTVTLDRAPDDGVGGVSGADGEVGGALDVITDAFVDNATLIVPGQTIYVKNDGTMTLTGVIAQDNVNGTSALKINFEGYNSARGDNPTLTDRPIIAAGANAVTWGDFLSFKNFIWTTTESNGINYHTSNVIYNSKSTNSSGTASRSAFRGALYGNRFVLCEAISTVGDAFESGTSGSRTHVAGCYFHDSNRGALIQAFGFTAHNTIFDTNTTAGAYATAADDAHRFWNNTFYNNGTAILMSTNNTDSLIMNNIFDANTVGVTWNLAGVYDLTNFFDYNVWDNTKDMSWDNGTTEDNAQKGANSVDGDPGLTNPAAGDFTLGSGSNALDTGVQPGVTVGATGDYKWNIGADQDDVTAAGGGGGRRAGWSIQ